MTLTPLFTAAELTAQIAAYKQALLDLAAGKAATVDTGGVRRSFEAHETDKVLGVLEFLQNQRAALELGSGPQVLTGRPRR